MRINIINPKYLTDQHLIAELNEINMVSQSFKRSYYSKNGIKDIPNEFCLNKNHVKFFYNKGLYLHKRYLELRKEGLKRGFNLKEIFKNYFYWLDEKYYNDWKPNKKDKKIIIERIIERINLKSNFYRYYRKPLIRENYFKLLEEV